MNQNLTDILDGCRRRNRKDQQALYKHFYGYGMSIGFRYAKNEAGAISILNDSFLKVFDRINKFDPDRPFKPWFRQIVVNTSIDYVKKENKLMMHTDINEVNDLSDREDILSRIGYKELMGMVQSLSLAYRTVFNMHVIDGFKHEEIANKLGITVGTSKSNLSKARQKLQALVLDRLKVNQHG